jgi:hypothetical protein
MRQMKEYWDIPENQNQYDKPFRDFINFDILGAPRTKLEM